MIRTLAAITSGEIHIAGYRALRRLNRAAIYLIDNAERWKKRIVKEVMIFGTIAVITLGWVLFCQIIADSQISWHKQRQEVLEICEGLTIDIIYLE